MDDKEFKIMTLKQQISIIQDHIISLYDKSNALYDLINSMGDQWDINNPYYIRARAMIDHYSETIKMEKDNRDIIEKLIKELENDQ